MIELEIGPAGGVLDGEGIRVEFPAGAVARRTTIRARRVGADEMGAYPAGTTGPVFELEPSGLTFHRLPTMTLAFDDTLCAADFRAQLATVDNGAWVPIEGSQREGCSVTGQVAHFSPFAPLPPPPTGLPLSQTAQQYLIEAVLNGVYLHRPGGQFREFRSDGLATIGMSRFAQAPKFCLLEPDPARRDKIRDELIDAVETLSGGQFVLDPNTDFEFGAACYDPNATIDCPTSCQQRTLLKLTGSSDGTYEITINGTVHSVTASGLTINELALELIDEINAGSESVTALLFGNSGVMVEAESGSNEFVANTASTADPIEQLTVVPFIADQITVFRGQFCSTSAIACYTAGDPVGLSRGDAIRGGVLKYKLGDLFDSGALFRAKAERLIRHELGHVFGLFHTFGEPDVMNGVILETPADFVAQETEVFDVLYQLPPGLGLSDLIAIGVISEDRSVLDPQPEAFFIGDDEADPELSAAVGQTIKVNGIRMSFAFDTEADVGSPGVLPDGDSGPHFRVGYHPPVAQFTDVELVVDPGAQVNPFIAMSKQFKVDVPLRATDEFAVRTRDQVSAPVPNFQFATPAIPPPGTNPKPVENLTCSPTSGGRTFLSWTLPTEREDNTPIGPNNTLLLFHNGSFRRELTFDETQTTDPPPPDPISKDLYPPFVANLYQLFVRDDDTGEISAPSTVCETPPRADRGEVSQLLIDRTESMTQSVGGISRFERVVGPLPSPQIPRAFAALNELFGSPGPPPRVSICSFNSQEFLVDEIASLDPNFIPDGTCETFTTDRSVAEAAILAVRAKGADHLTPLADAMCIALPALASDFEGFDAGTVTARIFTDGGENFSTGNECPPPCPDQIAVRVDWNASCDPGTCPLVTIPCSSDADCPGNTSCLPPGAPDAQCNLFPESRYVREPTQCADCQLAVFEENCRSGVNFFVNYFGPPGPFSPLPSDAAYFKALAAGTGGSFVYNTDDGQLFTTVPGDAVPIAVPPEHITAETEPGETSAIVQLQGSAYDDGPSSALTFNWFGDFPEGGGQVAGNPAFVTLPAGSRSVGLVVSDEHQDSLPVSGPVDVVCTDDQTPPIIETVQVRPDCLWPPKHKWLRFEFGTSVRVQASDACDPSPTVSVVDIVSNEPVDGVGDGHTSPDFLLDDDGFCLRTERSGAGDGRTYTVRFVAEDDAGNRSVPAEAEVLVVHDQSDGCPRLTPEQIERSHSECEQLSP